MKKNITDTLIEFIEEYREEIEENFKNNQDGDYFNIAINYGDHTFVERQQGKEDILGIRIERKIKGK